MEKFIIKKNTLPYVHQWAVINNITGKKAGEYKTKELAKEALKVFQQQGMTSGIPIPNQTEVHQFAVKAIKNAIEAAQKRMQQPEGDPQPELPRHSNKRRVELD